MTPGASLFAEPPDHRLEDLHERLLAYYGRPVERERWDPLTQFIYSLLSSRTKTEASHEVLRNLRAVFGTWENLRDAPVAEIEEAIRAATFPERKAVQLKTALEQITARYGTLTLDFLASYKTEKIREWLERFDGVGVKTSGAVVNFSTLRRRAMCIDSHHLRIVQRLGFVPKSANARETETRLMEMAPTAWGPEMLDEHHSLVKLHGQRLCLKNEMRCERCPLLDVCAAGGARR
ncbi:endonuclease III domain-containing protein [Granulicella arctica]|uniref:Endonuclease-3 n=1 Tax=Granulicella arctica TaxID=940613 RepID=A0A7Y9PGK0_9BACT|nr:iron-sulfur cluster loop [Granulicella arctica]NYF78756.1 endonuclease-3 [Granulicella arctica]